MHDYAQGLLRLRPVLARLLRILKENYRFARKNETYFVVNWYHTGSDRPQTPVSGFWRDPSAPLDALAAPR